MDTNPAWNASAPSWHMLMHSQPSEATHVQGGSNPQLSMPYNWLQGTAGSNNSEGRSANTTVNYHPLFQPSMASMFGTNFQPASNMSNFGTMQQQVKQPQMLPQSQGQAMASAKPMQAPIQQPVVKQAATESFSGTSTSFATQQHQAKPATGAAAISTNDFLSQWASSSNPPDLLSAFPELSSLTSRQPQAVPAAAHTTAGNISDTRHVISGGSIGGQQSQQQQQQQRNSFEHGFGNSQPTAAAHAPHVPSFAQPVGGLQQGSAVVRQDSQLQQQRVHQSQLQPSMAQPGYSYVAIAHQQQSKQGDHMAGNSTSNPPVKRPSQQHGLLQDQTPVQQQQPAGFVSQQQLQPSLAGQQAQIQQRFSQPQGVLYGQLLQQPQVAPQQQQGYQQPKQTDQLQGRESLLQQQSQQQQQPTSNAAANQPRQPSGMVSQEQLSSMRVQPMPFQQQQQQQHFPQMQAYQQYYRLPSGQVFQMQAYPSMLQSQGSLQKQGSQEQQQQPQKFQVIYGYPYQAHGLQPQMQQQQQPQQQQQLQQTQQLQAQQQQQPPQQTQQLHQPQQQQQLQAQQQVQQPAQPTVYQQRDPRQAPQALAHGQHHLASRDHNNNLVQPSAKQPPPASQGQTSAANVSVFSTPQAQQAEQATKEPSKPSSPKTQTQSGQAALDKAYSDAIAHGSSEDFMDASLDKHDSFLDNPDEKDAPQQATGLDGSVAASQQPQTIRACPVQRKPRRLRAIGDSSSADFDFAGVQLLPSSPPGSSRPKPRSRSLQRATATGPSTSNAERKTAPILPPMPQPQQPKEEPDQADMEFEPNSFLSMGPNGLELDFENLQASLGFKLDDLKLPSKDPQAGFDVDADAANEALPGQSAKARRRRGKAAAEPAVIYEPIPTRVHVPLVSVPAYAQAVELDESLSLISYRQSGPLPVFKSPASSEMDELAYVASMNPWAMNDAKSNRTGVDGEDAADAEGKEDQANEDAKAEASPAPIQRARRDRAKTARNDDDFVYWGPAKQRSGAAAKDAASVKEETENGSQETAAGNSVGHASDAQKEGDDKEQAVKPKEEDGSAENDEKQLPPLPAEDEVNAILANALETLVTTQKPEAEQASRKQARTAVPGTPKGNNNDAGKKVVLLLDKEPTTKQANIDVAVDGNAKQTEVPGNQKRTLITLTQPASKRVKQVASKEDPSVPESPSGSHPSIQYVPAHGVSKVPPITDPSVKRKLKRRASVDEHGYSKRRRHTGRGHRHAGRSATEQPGKVATEQPAKVTVKETAKETTKEAPKEAVKVVAPVEILKLSDKVIKLPPRDAAKGFKESVRRAKEVTRVAKQVRTTLHRDTERHNEAHKDKDASDPSSSGRASSRRKPAEKTNEDGQKSDVNPTEKVEEKQAAKDVEKDDSIKESKPSKPAEASALATKVPVITRISMAPVTVIPIPARTATASPGPAQKARGGRPRQKKVDMSIAIRMFTAEAPYLVPPKEQPPRPLRNQPPPPPSISRRSASTDDLPNSPPPVKRLELIENGKRTLIGPPRAASTPPQPTAAGLPAVSHIAVGEPWTMRRLPVLSTQLPDVVPGNTMSSMLEWLRTLSWEAQKKPYKDQGVFETYQHRYIPALFRARECLQTGQLPKGDESAHPNNLPGRRPLRGIERKRAKEAAQLAAEKKSPNPRFYTVGELGFADKLPPQRLLTGARYQAALPPIPLPNLPEPKKRTMQPYEEALLGTPVMSPSDWEQREKTSRAQTVGRGRQSAALGRGSVAAPRGGRGQQAALARNAAAGKAAQAAPSTDSVQKALARFTAAKSVASQKAGQGQKAESTTAQAEKGRTRAGAKPEPTPADKDGSKPAEETQEAKAGVEVKQEQPENTERTQSTEVPATQRAANTADQSSSDVKSESIPESGLTQTTDTAAKPNTAEEAGIGPKAEPTAEERADKTTVNGTTTSVKKETAIAKPSAQVEPKKTVITTTRTTLVTVTKTVTQTAKPTTITAAGLRTARRTTVATMQVSTERKRRVADKKAVYPPNQDLCQRVAKQLAAATSLAERHKIMDEAVEIMDRTVEDLLPVLGLANIGSKACAGWSADDEAAFAAGLKDQDRQFQELQDKFLPHKSMADIVSYYYNIWKIRYTEDSVAWHEERKILKTLAAEAKELYGEDSSSSDSDSDDDDDDDSDGDSSDDDHHKMKSIG